MAKIKKGSIVKFTDLDGFLDGGTVVDFSRILSGSKMKIYSYKPKGENCNINYAVKASDRIWYNWFISKGFCVSKSKTEISIQYPDEVNFRHFVRGLFDSDGCFSDDGKLMWFQIMVKRAT